VARNLTILVVEDDPDDFLLVQIAFRDRVKGVELRLVENGEEMLDYLRQKGKFETPASAPEPCLILLDINMPGMDGMVALGELKTDPSLRHIPVVMLTTSNDTDDITACYRLGANSYMVKPASYDQLVSIITSLMDYWGGTVELPLDATDRGLTQITVHKPNSSSACVDAEGPEPYGEVQNTGVGAGGLDA
jgi:CheY-like chemotaxis protein